MSKVDYTQTPSRIIVRGVGASENARKIQSTLERLYPGSTVNIQVMKK